MADIENLREKNIAYFESAVLRMDVLLMMQRIKDDRLFSIEEWRRFTNTLPRFIKAMADLAVAQGADRSDLLPVRTGLGPPLPQMDMQALSDYVERVSKEDGQNG